MLFKESIKQSYSAIDPANGSSFVSDGGIDYLIGALMILLGLCFLLMIRTRKQRMLEYKEEQLKVYRKNHPRDVNKTYEQTGLFLPFWERVKYSSPIILTLSFVIIGITFIVGHPISHL